MALAIEKKPEGDSSCCDVSDVEGGQRGTRDQISSSPPLKKPLLEQSVWVGLVAGRRCNLTEMNPLAYLFVCFLGIFDRSKDLPVQGVLAQVMMPLTGVTDKSQKLTDDKLNGLLFSNQRQTFRMRQSKGHMGQ